MRDILIEDKKFVFAGRFGNKKKDLIDEIKRNKGIIENELTKETNYLVIGKQPGGKPEKAKLLGVKIIPFEELENFLEELRFQKAHAPTVSDRVPSSTVSDMLSVQLKKVLNTQNLQSELYIQKGYYPKPLTYPWQRGDNCFFYVQRKEIVVANLSLKPIIKIPIANEICEISNVFRWNELLAIIDKKNIGLYDIT
ncbi:MAG: hypothetical protein NZ108_08315, partial [Bacteroidia bacterium]|nr:hypothetical protein [Bacteroidia bacterium]